MNILLFTESGLGIGNLVVDQFINLIEVNPNTHAVLSSLEQEEGQIELIKSRTNNYLELPGLENHASFKGHCRLLADYIHANDISIVHVQTNWELALMVYVKYFLLHKWNLKLIYTIHGYRNNYKYKKYLALLLLNCSLFLFADFVICSCSFLKKRFLLCRHKIAIIPFGIKDSYFPNEFAIDDDSLQLIYPARFRIGKNQDMLIKAFANYLAGNKEDSRSRLFLPGDGEFLDEMKQLVHTLKLEERVVFPGLLAREEMEQLYKQCNIAVIPSSSETFGQCIVEPYIIGKCIVTRLVGVAEDIVKEGVNGLLFDNQQELERALSYLAENKSKIKEFGYRNFQTGNQFRWDKVTQLYLAMLSQFNSDKI